MSESKKRLLSTDPAEKSSSVISLLFPSQTHIQTDTIKSNKNEN